MPQCSVSICCYATVIELEVICCLVVAPTVTVLNNRIYQREYGTVVLTCIIKAFPLVYNYWVKGGQPIREVKGGKFAYDYEDVSMILCWNW